MLNKLGAIDDLRQDLIRAGVTPRMILSFRGHAGRFIHTEVDRIPPEDREVAAAIAWVAIVAYQQRGYAYISP